MDARLRHGGGGRAHRGGRVRRRLPALGPLPGRRRATSCSSARRGPGPSPAQARWRPAWPHRGCPRPCATLGLTSPGALGTLFVLGPGRLAAFAGGAPRHTDDRPLLELRAARSMLANTSGENRRALLEAATDPVVEPWASLIAAVTAEDLVERGRSLERSTGLALALEAYARALRLDPRNADGPGGTRAHRGGERGPSPWWRASSRSSRTAPIPRAPA